MYKFLIHAISFTSHAMGPADAAARVLGAAEALLSRRITYKYRHLSALLLDGRCFGMRVPRQGTLLTYLLTLYLRLRELLLRLAESTTCCCNVLFRLAYTTQTWHVMVEGHKFF